MLNLIKKINLTKKLLTIAEMLSTLLEEYNYSYVNTELNKKVKNPKGGRVFEK